MVENAKEEAQCVMILALGLLPKQGLAKVRAKNEAHTFMLLKV